MSLTQQEKEHYAKRINGLFGGAIHATPDQVTEEAARIADVMFTEICNCHIWLAPFPAVAEAIAAGVAVFIPVEIKVLFGTKTFKEYISEKAKGRIYSLLKLSKAKKAYSFLEKLQEIWLKYTDKNRKMQLCINVARRNWRSAMEIELLGL